MEMYLKAISEGDYRQPEDSSINAGTRLELLDGHMEHIKRIKCYSLHFINKLFVNESKWKDTPRWKYEAK